EEARLHLLRLLVASGRRQEAESHFEAAERLFREVGPEAPVRLARLWRDILKQTVLTPPDTARAAADLTPSSPTVQVRALEAGGFVGREHELSRLKAALDDSIHARRMRVITILGEPGIGKTRLLAELCTHARGRSAKILSGRCYDSRIGAAYGPWIEALGELPR